MRRQSFRSIITISLVLVISAISFSAFFIYNRYLKGVVYSESESNTLAALETLDLLKDQLYYSIEEHDGSILSNLLQKMNNKEQVLNAYLFNSEGTLQYSLHENHMEIISIQTEELSALSTGVSLKYFTSIESPFSRAYIRMKNAPACYECHNPEIESLGFVVIDLSMGEDRDNRALIGRSSLFFTISMVVVIISFIIFLHYRFVRKSLREFNNTIDQVNQGKLNSRLSIPETKELGRLGKNFNNMLDTFQMAQNELQEYHKKELRSKYKLATVGEMSARLAHEIRNPITGIANASEIIVKETSDQENKPILEEIQRQATRVNEAISSLLKYSRKKDVNLLMNNINEVITQLGFFLQHQVQQKEIIFNLELQEDIPYFRFDHEQMEDVLLNLGLNAIQAIQYKGVITYKTAYDPNSKIVHIYITDTGRGIPEEAISQIFHPFFTTRNEGTGLGLAIVKDVIDKHDGEIWAENNKSGGCTFTISLPLEL